MILVLKTADRTTQLWLVADHATVAPETEPNLDWESGRQLSDDLLGRLVHTIEADGQTLKDLTGIVVFSGPGSFTSLRIGHTVVNALADSLAIPVVGARGDTWVGNGLVALQGAKSGSPALPYYGADAHITRPKA